MADLQVCTNPVARRAWAARGGTAVAKVWRRALTHAGIGRAHAPRGD